ncbi:MAG: hypothetical protein KBF43_01710 [Dermatophilaceae bacterium]|jgi:hypothetical protein|nr:hypothetical protein [Dermatophilaceae bacterium]MBP9917286.1 hypothetical protein [Dermatophilaceae bacterium]
MKRSILAAAALGGAAMIALAPTASASNGTGNGIAFWTQGALKPGATIDIYASCGMNSDGFALREGTVVGPSGMRVQLTPMASGGYLGGELVVPKTFKGTSAQLSLVCDTVKRSTVTVTAASTKSRPVTSAVKPASATPTTAPLPVSPTPAKPAPAIAAPAAPTTPVASPTSPAPAAPTKAPTTAPVAPAGAPAKPVANTAPAQQSNNSALIGLGLAAAAVGIGAGAVAVRSKRSQD